MVSTIISLVSWASLFLLSWLMILRVLPRNDLFIWGFALIFAILIFFAEAWRASKNKEKTQ